MRVFTKRGNLKFEFGSDEELQHPSDLTITREGCIAVTDCGFLAVKVLLFDLTSVLSLFAKTIMYIANKT